MNQIPIKDRPLGNPERYSLLWNFLLRLIIRPWLQVWYKRITVTGRENIPRNKPIIFAPNHQNGLVDPLLILTTSRRQIVWLATADYFKNRFFARLLRRLRVVPVHRLKDGSDVMGQNRMTFTKCAEVLQRKHEIGLFPEGIHWGLQRLRPSQRTIARLAFLAEELNDFKLDVQIVPVGITYSHYFHFHHNVLIQYGKPISVQQFKSSYKDHSDRAEIELCQTLDAALLELMIHIPSEEYYADIRQLLLTCDFNFMRKMGETKKHLIRKFVAHKQLTDVLLKQITLAPIEAEALFKKTAEYRELLQKLNLHDSVLDTQYSFARIVCNALILLICAPLFVFGTIINIIPFYVPYRKVRLMYKDNLQLISSVSLTAALPIFLTWYALLIFVCSCFVGLQWYLPVLFASFGVLGMAAFHWRRSFLRNKQRVNIRLMKMQNKQQYEQLFALRNQLISSTMAIFEQHKGAWGKNKKRNM